MKKYILACFVFLIVFMCQAQEKGILSIGDFVQEDTSDYTAYFKTVTSKAVEQQKATIALEPRTYHFRDTKAIEDFDAVMTGEVSNTLRWGAENQPYNMVMDFKNMEEIILDGHGAQLFFHGLTQPFSFRNCKKITLKNFSIDVGGRLPWSVGKVRDTKLDTIYVETLPGYALKGGEPVWSVADYDPITRIQSEIWEKGNSGPIQWRKTGEVSFVNKSVASTIKPGRWVILQHIGSYRPAIHFFDCQDIVLENVTIYAHPGSGIIVHKSKNIALKAINIKPENGRLRSVNQDGVQFIHCTGKITVDDSHFIGMENGVKINSYYLEALALIDEKTLTVKAGTSPDFEYDFPALNDSIEFTDKNTLLPLGKTKVTFVEIDKSKNSANLRFARALPANLIQTTYLANSSSLPRVRLSNCVVKDNCGKGLILHTRNATVENSIFDHTTGTGIEISTSSFAKESISAQNITIRNNTFLACGNNAGSINECSGIVVHTESKNQAQGVHKNLTIENNYIYSYNKYGIHITCADQITLKNNRIDNAKTGIKIDFSKNGKLLGNKGGEKTIDIGENCIKNTFTIK